MDWEKGTSVGTIPTKSMRMGMQRGRSWALWLLRRCRICQMVRLSEAAATTIAAAAVVETETETKTKTQRERETEAEIEREVVALQSQIPKPQPHTPILLPPAGPASHSAPLHLRPPRGERAAAVSLHLRHTGTAARAATGRPVPHNRQWHH